MLHWLPEMKVSRICESAVTDWVAKYNSCINIFITKEFLRDLLLLVQVDAQGVKFRGFLVFLSLF